MKRTSLILVVGAVLIGYGALSALGVMVIQQQSQIRSIQARLGSPAAAITSSPAASPSSASSPAVSPSPVPSPFASPTTSSAFAQLTKVTDNNGHSWVNHVPGQLVTEEPVGATVTFTTVAQDPMDRPIEYAYTIGGPPTGLLTLLCNWGGPSCTRTPTESGTFFITAYVRAKNAPGRTPCGLDINLGACDDSLNFGVYLGRS